MKINTPVPRRQDEAFQLAMCKRLGLNPDEVGPFQVQSDGEHARVTVTAFLPEQEVREMFNAAGKVDGAGAPPAVDGGLRAAVEALHMSGGRNHWNGERFVEWCIECRKAWPCPTLGALNVEERS